MYLSDESGAMFVARSPRGHVGRLQLHMRGELRPERVVMDFRAAESGSRSRRGAHTAGPPPNRVGGGLLFVGCRSEALDDRGVRHAAALAHHLQAESSADGIEMIDQRPQQARA